MAYDLESRRGLLGAQQKIDALKEYAGEENMTLEHPTCVQQTLVDSPQRNLTVNHSQLNHSCSMLKQSSERQLSIQDKGDSTLSKGPTRA